MTEPQRTSGLSIRRFQAEAGTHVWFSGIIDESFPADAFSAIHGLAVVDLGGITRITSFGIREWCRSLLSIDAVPVYFTNVASCVVPQFAMVTGFAGPTGQILSYRGDYECEKCGATRTRTFDRRTDPDEAWATGAPETLCTICKLPMTFGDLAESHRIALVETGPLREHPSLAATATAGESPAAKEEEAKRAEAPRPRTTATLAAVAWTYPFEIHKQVNDKATLLWMSGTLDAIAGFRHVADGLEGDVVLVAPGIIGCDDAGVDVLRGVIDAAKKSGGRVWLARCSPVFVAALARRPEVLGRDAALISVEHGVPCPRCKVDAPYFWTCDSNGKHGVYCCRCQASCPTPNESLSASIEQLHCTAAPEWLRSLVAVPPVSRAPGPPPPSAPRWVWGVLAVGVIGVLASSIVSYKVLHAPKRRILDDAAVAEASPPEEAPPPITDWPAAPAPELARAPRPRGKAVARGTALGAPDLGTIPPAVAERKPEGPKHDARTLDELMRTRRLPGDSTPVLDDDGPTLPKTLTKEQLDASMSALKGSVKDCYLQYREKGDLLVTGTVSPTGRLQAIEVGGVLAQSPTGECVRSAARHASFPRFSGAPVQLTYPYKLP